MLRDANTFDDPLMQKILTQNLRQWGPDWHTSMMRSVRPCMWSGVITAMLTRAGQGLYSEVEMHSGIGDSLWTAYQYISWAPHFDVAAQSDDATAAALRVLCMDLTSIITYAEARELPGSQGPSQYLLIDLANLLSDSDRRVVLGRDVRRSGKRLACRNTGLTDDCFSCRPS